MTPALLALLLLAPPPSTAPAPVAASDPARLLARITVSEPTVEEVQAAAARHAESATPDPAELARRRRLSALLPRLTAEVRHEERDYRVVGMQGTSEVDYLRSSPGTSIALHATWELGDLVATTGEAAAAAAALARATRRDEAIRKATALFFERRHRLLALLADPPGDARARVEAELELARVTAELDALTGGRLAGRRP
jgi:hypothetical protein